MQVKCRRKKKLLMSCRLMSCSCTYRMLSSNFTLVRHHVMYLSLISTNYNIMPTIFTLAKLWAHHNHTQCENNEFVPVNANLAKWCIKLVFTSISTLLVINQCSVKLYVEKGINWPLIAILFLIEHNFEFRRNYFAFRGLRLCVKLGA